jgi:hypothetical protein
VVERDLDAIFEEAEVALELEEVVAIGTDPMRAVAGETVALFGDRNELGASSEPDATMALFADSKSDLGAHPGDATRGDDSGADLDDLFADLVKD